jgi:small subunit ribosomal protein S1
LDTLSSSISTIVPIRHIVNGIVKETAAGIGSQGYAVAEGRDMTTVVFPDADFRFYLDATPDARAKRRFEQGISALQEDEIKAAMVERDRVDSTKIEGSLKIGEGVNYLDTTHLTLCEVYERLESIIKGR